MNGLFAAMREEAESGGPAGGARARRWSRRALAFMRYRGQGHEIAVPLPNQAVRRRCRARPAPTLRGDL